MCSVNYRHKKTKAQFTQGVSGRAEQEVDQAASELKDEEIVGCSQPGKAGFGRETP